MGEEIHNQSKWHLAFYGAFGLISLVLIMYYLSNTIIHFTTPQQFPINSFKRFPLTFLIFPAELFSFLFSMYFVYNLTYGNTAPPPPARFRNRTGTKVAIIIPVYNEPKAIVSRTLSKADQIIWDGGIKLYLLDDSNNEDSRKQMQELARRYNATLVRRPDHEGYKAGNINNGIMRHIKEDFFVIFDCDQAASPEFLEETMDYFSDPDVGFVQTPQHFTNKDTLLERAQQLGTNIFYQSQCMSKAKDWSMPFCGTNVVVRTEAFRKVNGFAYYTATEDIELGIRMNEEGYYGAYVPKIMAHGYSPTDFKSYSSQQYRWANGNLAIIRNSWRRILFGKFSLRQQIHILFTSGWWLVGIVNLIYMIVPILSFFLGGTHHTWLPTWLLILLFLNVALGISMIRISLAGREDGERITLVDAFLQYSLITNSMFIYMRAAINAALGRYIGFVRTSKERQKSGWQEVKWNLLLSAVFFCLSIVALFKASTAGNVEQLRAALPISIWMLFYSLILASSLLFVGGLPKGQRASNPGEEDE